MNSGSVKINMNNMNIPDNIKKLIESKKFTVDDVGMSQSNVVFYDDMILKTDIEQGEVNMMKWLDGKLPVPKVIAYENNCLLMSKINGKMLCDDKYMTNPDLLISLLAEALNMFWGVDTHCCPCDYSLENCRIQS